TRVSSTCAGAGVPLKSRHATANACRHMSLCIRPAFFQKISRVPTPSSVAALPLLSIIVNRRKGPSPLAAPPRARPSPGPPPPWPLPALGGGGSCFSERKGDPAPRERGEWGGARGGEEGPEENSCEV